MGKKIRCPACKNVVDTGAAKPVEPGSALAPAPPAPAPVTPAPPPPPVKPPGDGLPPTMLATKQIAGRTCPACGRVLALGEPVRNCEKCTQSFHEPCWIQNGGCTVKGCGLPMEDGAGDAATRRCPRCGGSIPAEARKCPLCREWIEQGGVAVPPGPAGYAPPPSGFAPPPQAYYPPMESSPSGLAIASLITGILSVLMTILACLCPLIPALAAIPAIITGIMGINQVNREPHRTGKGMAIAGLVCGIVAIVLSGLLFLLMLAGQSMQ